MFYMEPAAFILAYAAACVALLPASALTVAAGAYFGPAKAFALVSAGSMLGATAAFLLGRHALRGWVERKLAGNPKLAAVDAAVEKQGWKVVLLLRLSPLIPFNLLNYALGLTKVPAGQYVLASWLGMMPGTALFVLLGASARRPAALTVAGLAATAAAVWLVTREAKKALTAYSASEPPAAGS